MAGEDWPVSIGAAYRTSATGPFIRSYIPNTGGIMGHVAL